jgi:hypothetical protein
MTVPGGEPVGSGAPSTVPTTPTPSADGARVPNIVANLECPAGTFASNTPVSFCTDGSKAFAPYTNAMLLACNKSFGSGCYDSLWSNQMYSTLRGAELCPMGSEWNAQHGVCVEGTTVLGPFKQSFVDKCVAAGFGNICYGMKIDLAYVSLVNLAR